MSRASARRSGGRADRDHAGGAGDARQGDRAEADRAGPLHDDRVAEPDLGALGDVHGGQQAAAAADVVVEVDRVGQPRERDARLEIDRLRPSRRTALRRRDR